jgi:predicted dehydrogenase
MIRQLSFALVASMIAVSLASAQPPQVKPLRIAIAGLNHGHVTGFLRSAERRAADIVIVAVWDPEPALLAKYAKSNHFAESQLYTDLDKMLDAVKPEAVATFTDTYSHAGVVEACVPRHIPVMMEKPLAVDRKQARAIQQASQRYSTPVIVNYETTWYRSHGEIWTLLHDQKAAGDIRRMVAMDGHQGPHEIHVQPEFFAWLSDPVRNGAGALFDFGCYGANLMTWMMDNQRPLKVTALTQTDKPGVYAHVDDEATVLLEYPKAQGVIEASWNWPVSRKDFEVYGATGYAIATGGDNLRLRLPGTQAEETRTPPALQPQEADSISYLIAVARGQLKPAGLSSLENNMIVIEILDAARESARTGRTITLER